MTSGTHPPTTDPQATQEILSPDVQLYPDNRVFDAAPDRRASLNTSKLTLVFSDLLVELLFGLPKYFIVRKL